MIYTMDNIKEGIQEVRNGKYVDFNISAAFHAIRETQYLGRDWEIFLSNASKAILNSRFEPLSFEEIKDFVVHGLSHPSQNPLTPAVVSEMFSSGLIYGQRRNIKVEGTKAEIFIFRTPNLEEFNKAQIALILVIEMFKIFGDNLEQNVAIPDMLTNMEITVRKNEKFFDVKIPSLNDRAWCGFDFRGCNT